MPVNRRHVPRGMPAQICRALNAAVHSAFVDACGVHPQDDFTYIARYDAEDMLLNPDFLGPRDPGQTILLETTILAGRTPAQKEAFYTALYAALPDIGLNPRNLIVSVTEATAHDFAFGPEGSVHTALGLQR